MPVHAPAILPCSAMGPRLCFAGRVRVSCGALICSVWQVEGITWGGSASAYGTCGSRFVNALLKESYGSESSLLSSAFAVVRLFCTADGLASSIVFPDGPTRHSARGGDRRGRPRAAGSTTSRPATTSRTSHSSPTSNQVCQRCAGGVHVDAR
eukprot:3649478-Rhodomonas_salina.8